MSRESIRNVRYDVNKKMLKWLCGNGRMIRSTYRSAVHQDHVKSASLQYKSELPERHFRSCVEITACVKDGGLN